MTVERYNLVRKPRNVAAVYALVGGLWILLTDQFVRSVADDPATVTLLQTAKGWLFVGLSTLLIYALVWHAQRELRDTNDHLERSLQQTSILHRIVRHNLRNACTIIDGHARLLADGEGDRKKCTDTIRTQSGYLTEISEKTRQLREIALVESTPTESIDVAGTLRRQITAARRQHPEADVRLDTPTALWADVHPRIGAVFDEIVENAIEHAERSDPTVEVSASAAATDVVVEITDEGPGFPKLERDVLDREFEAPLAHSTGLGLWIARTIVDRSNGRIDAVDTDPRGATVRITLPRADPPSNLDEHGADGG